MPIAVRRLSNLRKLNLGRNRISSIPLRAFYSNPKLEQLILKRNNFLAFPDCILPPGLVKLSLGMNKISAIQDIRYLKHLKVLRLEANTLRYVNTHALPPSIRELRLCNNSLSSFFSFRNLPNLRRLRLAGNPEITEIGRRTFSQSIIPLVELDLRGCGIRHIDEFAFSCLPRLRSVELQSNQLTNYNTEWFAFNFKVTRVGLSDNPWHCDCRFAQQLGDLADVVNNTINGRSPEKRKR